MHLCNSSAEYGLGSSVFSLDYKRAERIAARLQAGMSNVNDFGVNYLCQSLPFGGVKGSGLGREGVVNAIHEMSQPKTYCFNLQ